VVVVVVLVVVVVFFVFFFFPEREPFCATTLKKGFKSPTQREGG